MKTQAGMECYGCFSIGRDELFARSLFNSLEGDDQVSLDSVIIIDLIRRENGVPYPFDLKHCSYDQLAGNVKQITKELFKQLNLER